MNIWYDIFNDTFITTIKLEFDKFIVSKDSWRFSGSEYTYEQLKKSGFYELGTFQ